jgi:predicted ATPase/DNA-binding CsgD family transcriptional regulator
MALETRALSARQAEIASLIASGKSNREIAEALCLSERTIETHVTALFNKLNVRSRTELVAAVLNPAFIAAQPTHTKSNLPLLLNRLVGREAEIAYLTGLLTNQRLVTVTGAGGIGKTRLALAVASDLMADCADGAWFVELAPLSAGSLVVTAITQALGVQEAPNLPPLETLIRHLRRRALVLILDNCEHVVEEAARVADALLRRCAEVRIVATSRVPLQIAGERSYRVPSLTFPTLAATRDLPADQANAYGAIALFVERAQAVDHQFRLTDEQAPIVAEICRRLDGIPLAIELAAARIRMLSARQLHERLGERFRLLTGSRRDLLPRHQTLRALIDWSHDLLNARERALFRRLGVFANGFALEGALAVGNGEGLDRREVFDVLESLLEQSLVLADPDGDALRYRLLESTRAYAREKLEAAGEFSASVTRHLRYLGDLFAAARTRAEHDGRLTEIDALLVAEVDDVRAALDGLGGGTQLETGAEMLAAIDERWSWIGIGSEGSWRLERLLSLLPTSERRLRSRLWKALALLARRTNPGRAFEAAFRAVEFAREVGDVVALADALPAYANELSRARAFEDAAALLVEAEAIAPVENVLLRLRITKSRAFLSYCLKRSSTR